MSEEKGEVTALLDELRDRQPGAEARLLALVYFKLKQLARGHLRGERQGHTLQATDLVHEAYLRLAAAEMSWQNRAHFFGVAAQAMRRILVDHARARRAQKRGDGHRKVPLDAALFVPAEQCEYLVEIDEALRKLSAIDQRQARVVELRFFADLSVEETADVLGCSDRTVKREWRMAQAWLRRELAGEDPKCDPNTGT
jgi:RNA polymerase sigma-70 factor, ECF subfamily